MGAVSERLQALKREGQCALIPFITAGDPDLDTTVQALRALDRAGADVIEVGVPYADSLADGPTIQEAANRALGRGTQLEDVLAAITSLRAELQAPLVLFAYFNPIYRCGIERFLDRIASAGASGLLVPDLPLEEAQRLLQPARERGIELTLLVAPTTPPDRLAVIAQQSQGFIYAVSVTGVTGARTELAHQVESTIAQLRAATDKPIGVGFGIAGPEQARQCKQWGADAAIVGSAFVRRLSDGSPEQGVAAVETFCRDLKHAIAP